MFVCLIVCVCVCILSFVFFLFFSLYVCVFGYIILMCTEHYIFSAFGTHQHTGHPMFSTRSPDVDVQREISLQCSVDFTEPCPHVQ